MNALVYNDRGCSERFRLEPSSFKNLKCLLFKNPSILDGFGEKKIIRKCFACNKDKIVAVCEICVVRFEDDSGEIKTITLSNNESYDIQTAIYKLNSIIKDCMCL